MISNLKLNLPKFLHCVLVIEIIAGSNALLSHFHWHCAAVQIFVYKLLFTNVFFRKRKKKSWNLSHFENERLFWNPFWKWKHVFLKSEKYIILKNAIGIKKGSKVFVGAKFNRFIISNRLDSKLFPFSIILVIRLNLIIFQVSTFSIDPALGNLQGLLQSQFCMLQPLHMLSIGKKST